jgi:uncharacterized OB-fold protein
MRFDGLYCDRCGKTIAEDMNYCPSCGNSLKGTVREEYTVQSDNLTNRVRELIHEGNVTRIIVKSENGDTLLEMPVTVGVIGTILAPWMAALGVIAALVTRCKVIVEKREI